MKSEPVIVLASRSPQRLQLLSLLVSPDRIIVQPPASSDEAGFDGLETLDAIENQVRSIARTKRNIVAAERSATDVIVAADTVIATERADGGWTVLGQPPVDDSWPRAVREWFETYYFGKTHLAMTGVSAGLGEHVAERFVTTRVTFSAERSNWLDWYLATGEPRGKAGGYAIQGLASVFVERIEGSLTNVIGLPVAELREVLLELGAIGD
jgi:septum formation protein